MGGVMGVRTPMILKSISSPSAGAVSNFLFSTPLYACAGSWMRIWMRMLRPKLVGMFLGNGQDLKPRSGLLRIYIFASLGALGPCTSLPRSYHQLASGGEKPHCRARGFLLQ